jgi:hypothetical protein
MTTIAVTEQQETMLSFIDPAADTFYLMVERHLCHDGLDADALRRALITVLDRHDVLRSSFHVEGMSYRPTGPAAELVERVWHHRSGFADVAAAVEAAQAEAAAPIDLTSSPPLRLWVGHVDSGESVVVVAGHHLVFDAWTFMLFYEDVSAEYERAVNRVEQPRPPAPQYAATRQTTTESSLEGWDALLGRGYGAVRRMATKAHDPRGPGAGLSRRWTDLDRRSLTMAGKAYRVTPYVLGAAAMLRALADVLCDDEVIFGSAHAGRATAESAETLGYFSTSLFVGADLASLRDDADLVSEVGAQLRRWHGTTRIQWEPLLEAYDAADLYPVKFACQPTDLAKRRLALPGCRIEPLERGTASTSARRPVDLITSYDADGLHASMRHRTDVVGPDQAERLLESFGAHLRALVHNAPVKD